MFSLTSADKELKDLYSEYQLFDYYRLIDIEKYAVYDYHNGSFQAQKAHCFDVWGRKRPCDNCSSRAAASSHRSIVKMEFKDGMLYLIFSLPIQLHGQSFVLELIKDVTDSVIVRGDDAKSQEISDLVTSMNEYVTHDSYTKLYNKRFAMQEIERCLSLSLNVTLALIDLDNFKMINDTYGHLMGDKTIQRLADLMNEYAQPWKIFACRIGGDEFLLIFENMKIHEVRHLCEELQQRFEQYEFQKEEEIFHITLSLGIAAGSPESTLEQLIEAADQAMYKVKKNKNMENVEKKTSI